MSAPEEKARRDHKRVQQIDDAGGVLQEFASGSACAAALRLTVSEVSATCTGRQKSAQGHLLQFASPEHREAAARKRAGGPSLLKRAEGGGLGRFV